MSTEVSTPALRQWTVGRRSMTDTVECELEECGDGYRARLTPLTLTEAQGDHWKQRIRLHHPTVERISIAGVDDFAHEIIVSDESLLSARETVSELACELDLLAYTLRREEPRYP